MPHTVSFLLRLVEDAGLAVALEGSTQTGGLPVGVSAVQELQQ